MASVNIKQHDLDIENRILSLMFKNENVIDIVIESNITDSDFSFDFNKTIFNELIDIYRDFETGGVCIGDDSNLLYERIKTGDRNEDKEILVNINKIKSSKTDDKHINIYVKKLKDLSKIRGVIQANRNVINYLKDNDEINADELVSIYDDSYQEVFANVISDTKSETTTEAVKTTIKEMIDDSMKETTIKFNLDGIDDYSKILNGYLTYIVGDTGVGKTTVGCYLATACALNGVKVLYVNMETKNEDCIKKLISANITYKEHRIKYSHLINPILMNEKDWDVIEQIATEEEPLEEYGIYWLFRPELSTSELRREIAKHVRKYDIDLVIGDYYQLLQKEGYEDSPESVIIPKISKDLMAIAGKKYLNPQGKQKHLGHVWLSQSNKEVIYRQDKHPTKDDLYYGGQRDARLVLGIFRDEYYDENTKKPGIMELGILKQNNGLTNLWFDYRFETQHQIIRDMTDEEREIFEEGLNDE